MAPIARLVDVFAATDRHARTLALALVAVAVLTATIGITVAGHASIVSARENVLRQRAMLDIAHARTEESAALARASAPVQIALADAIDQAFRGRAIAYRRTSDASQRDAESVVIDAVPFDALIGALDALARDHGVRPVDANVAARVDAGSVRAELTLAR